MVTQFITDFLVNILNLVFRFSTKQKPRINNNDVVYVSRLVN
jgi:hypothetical protein